MDNVSKLKLLLLKIEKNYSYFYVHGGDVLITLLTILIIIGVSSFISLKHKQKFYKRNWPKYRCDPSITPFAGFLNPPPESSFKEKVDYTLKNYAVCNLNILQGNFSLFTGPLTILQRLLANVLVLIVNAFDKIRVIFTSLRDAFMNIMLEAFEKLANVITGIQLYIINLKDMLSKMLGTMVNMLLFNAAVLITSLSVINNMAAALLAVLLMVTAIMILLVALAHIPGVGAIAGVILTSMFSTAYVILAVQVILLIIFSSDIKAAVTKNERQGSRQSGT
tara:strand:+ start:134 stop:970 length:837 start_codon:yes stop_codon:yes gene_type:complete